MRISNVPQKKATTECAHAAAIVRIKNIGKRFHQHRCLHFYPQRRANNIDAQSRLSEELDNAGARSADLNRRRCALSASSRREQRNAARLIGSNRGGATTNTDIRLMLRFDPCFTGVWRPCESQSLVSASKAGQNRIDRALPYPGPTTLQRRPDCPHSIPRS